jgi:hypothetical protein
LKESMNLKVERIRKLSGVNFQITTAQRPSWMPLVRWFGEG